MNDGGFGGMYTYNIASSISGYNAQYIAFHTHEGAVSSGERMRITSGGFTKISNSGSYGNVSGNYHEIRSNAGTNAIIISNTNASPYIANFNMSGTPNNNSIHFLYCEDSTALRINLLSNGGIANYQANNTNLSDIRTKKDITPLESYWDKFKAIEMVKFKYKDLLDEEEMYVKMISEVTGLSVQEIKTADALEIRTAGSWAGATYLGATGATNVIGTLNATWYITGVQLEVGSVATPFERRDYGTELNRCQRYFVSLSQPRLRGVGDGTNFQRMGISLPVTMRASPTVSLSGTITVYNGSATGTGTSVDVSYSTADSVELDIIKASGTSTAGTPSVAYITASNTSVVTGSSEL